MFLPVLPASGIGGWQYLQRTYDSQVDLYAKSPQIDRDIQYFKENISKVNSAEDLVKDRRMLSIALGAFGLQDDINNKFFIQKILEEGTTAQDSLANRFSDNRYKEFSAAFSLGPGEKFRLGETGFADGIVSGFRASSFETAVGDQNDDLRVALYAQRVLSEIVTPPEKPEYLQSLEEIAALVDEFAEEISEESDYFEENIGKIATVDELINDRRLLKFALTAFDLQDDFEAIENFQPASPMDVNEAEERIRSVLAEGSISVVASANKLGDSRYVELSRAFGFGIAEDLQSNDLGFAQDITDQYLRTNFKVPDSISYSDPFEILKGKVEVETFDDKDMSNDAKWLTIMGEPPLRILFERAFNLPSSFGQADIDQQLVVFKERARKEFGTEDMTYFASPENVDELITKFLARSQIASFSAATNSASIALTLLQS